MSLFTRKFEFSSVLNCCLVAFLLKLSESSLLGSVFPEYNFFIVDSTPGLRVLLSLNVVSL